jgi:hypothetical protein
MRRWLSSSVGFGLVAALYLLSFPYHPGIRSPNELCRLWQSRALVDHGTIVINDTLREFGPVGDLSCTARATFPDGHVELVPCVQAPPAGARLSDPRYYPSKAPMLSFLGAPVYAALKALKAPVTDAAQVLVSRLLLTVVPTLVMLVFLRRFLSAFVAAPLADTLVVVYALGTLAFSYSEQFLSHQLTAALLFFTFFVAWRVERGELRELALLGAGALAGAAVVTEYTGALGVVCVAAFVVAARWGRWPSLLRAAGLVVAGAAPLLVLLLWYHQAAFGDPLTSGYKFLNDPQYQGWHLGGFLGIRFPDPRAFVLSMASPLRGFFTLSPFLLLTFLGLGALKAKDRPQWVMLVVLLAANAYFTSSFTYDSWGWTTGPRHLTPVVPFLVLPVALALERLARGPRFALAAGLCVSSVLAMSLVTQVNYIPNDLETVDATGAFRVSTSLFGVALPLFREGFLPVSWLAAWVPNPASGALLLVLVAAAASWVFARFLAQAAAPGLVLAGALAHLGALAVVTEQHEWALSARRFLSGVWAARGGEPFSWW